MGSIFFITDCDPDINTGGGIIRRGQIEHLRNAGLNVIVVKPGDNNDYCTSTNTITANGFTLNSKFYYGLESLGLIADKYIKWSHNAVKITRKHLSKNDILFATSGGSLASIIAAYNLKKSTGAKLVINYHDPTDFTTLHGKYSRISKYYHINRDKFEKKLIEGADLIITSSESYREVLIEKYPSIKNRSCCNYFGYIKDYTIRNINKSYYHNDGIFNVVYGGNFGPTQAPEILGMAAKGLKHIKVFYIGNYKSNSAILELGQEPNIELIPAMPLPEYLSYLDSHADIGFFSLRNNLTNYCVPSKLFDYINVGLPMIGMVQGDAKRIIESNHYGFASDDSIDSLRHVLEKIEDPNILDSFRQNILRDKEKWSMRYQISQIMAYLAKLNSL